MKRSLAALYSPPPHTAPTAVYTCRWCGARTDTVYIVPSRRSKKGKPRPPYVALCARCYDAVYRPPVRRKTRKVVDPS